MNKRCYTVTFKIIKTIEFDDEEMNDYGYEGKITEEDRTEYLENLIEDEYNIGIPYDSLDIKRDCIRENELGGRE